MSTQRLEEPGYTQWVPTPPAATPGLTTRAVVLGGGGATGIAWLGGMVAGLREQGIDLARADTVIGTSAGSVVGAHLRLDASTEEAEEFTERFLEIPPIDSMGQIGGSEAFAMLRGSLHHDRSRGRRLVGQISTRANTRSEDSFIELVASDFLEADWPSQPLLITAVDTGTGASVVFHRDSGVPLARAVAASCSVPGVFPPVTVNGRQYMDGGVRSVANVDLAAGHDRVLVLAPIPYAVRRRNNPAQQARALRDRSRTLTLTPDLTTQRAVGLNLLDVRRTRPAYEAGLAQARRLTERVSHLWADDGAGVARR